MGAALTYLETSTCPAATDIAADGVLYRANFIHAPIDDYEEESLGAR